MSEKVENSENCDYDVVVPAHGGAGLLLKSPNERSQLWVRLAKARDREERELLVRAVAADLLEDLRSEFDLYSSYEDPFVETVLLLDRCGRLVEPDMLDHYKELGADEDGAGRKFFYAVIDRVAEIAGNRSYDPE